MTSTWAPTALHSKETELVFVQTDEHVLRLTVVVQHHLVRLSPKPGLLVSSERCVGWVVVVVVHPHTPGLNRAGNLVRLVHVPRPHTSTEPVDGVVSNVDGLSLCLEGCYSSHRSKDFFLEHLHRVVSLEYGGLDVETPIHNIIRSSPSQDLGALVLANV